MRMTCSVMSDRLLFTLLAITQASPNPWSIEFLYAVHEARHLWKTLCISETHVARSLPGSRHTYANTHSRPPSDCKMKLQEVQYWRVMTSTRKTNACSTYDILSIYLPTASATVRGGRYLQYSPKVTGKSGAEDGGEWIRKSDWMR